MALRLQKDIDRQDLGNKISDDDRGSKPGQSNSPSRNKRKRSSSRSLSVIIVGVIGAALLFLIARTVRWRRVKNGSGDEIDLSNLPSKIFVLWHGRQLMMPILYGKHSRELRRKLYTLISSHRDGRIISVAARLLGVHSVAGSSSRGAVEASRKLVELLNQGCDICITPDGPRGPVAQFKEGSLRIAQLTGAKIYPVSYGANSFWQFKSWDKMILPKPFARGCYVVGSPFEIPIDASATELAKTKTAIQMELNRLNALVDFAAKNVMQ